MYDDPDAPADTAVEHAAVATALSKLGALDDAPLGEHASIFEDVRSDLRSALDAD